MPGRLPDLSSKWLLWVVVIVVGLLLCAALVFSGYEIGRQDYDKTAYEYSSAFYVFIRCIFSGIGRFLHDNGEAIIAIFTIVLGIGTVFLARSTRRLASGAEETAERQLRAYVLATNAKANDLATGPIHELEISNGGQTPAYDVIVRYVIEIREFPTSIDFVVPIDTPNYSRTILAPNGKHHDLFRSPKVISPANLTGLMDGTRALYVFGHITYRDIFKKPRNTYFRLMCGGSVGLHPEGAMSPCQDGNEAD